MYKRGSFTLKFKSEKNSRISYVADQITLEYKKRTFK